MPNAVVATAEEAEDFTAAGEAEDSAGAEDFLVDMGLAAVEGFAAGAAARSVAALAGVHFVVAATSDVVTAVSVGGTDADTGAGTDSASA